MRKIFVDSWQFEVWQFKLFEDDKLLDSVTLNKIDDGLKLFNDYEYYADNKGLVAFEKKDDLKLAVELEFSSNVLLSYFLNTGSNRYWFEYNSKNYYVYDYFDIENKKVIIKDDILDFEFDIEKNIFINKGYKLDENNNKLAVDVPIDFGNCLGYIYQIYKPEFYMNKIISNQYKRFNNIDKDINKIQGQLKNLNIDLSPIDKKLDSSVKDILEKVDNSKKDIFKRFNTDDVVSEIQQITSKQYKYSFNKFQDTLQDVKNDLVDFFTLNITDLSLNGSNGAKFVDGEKVVIDGYSGIWEVVGSIQALVDENNLTIMYKVKKDNKAMIVPSAFVNNQGA